MDSETHNGANTMTTTEKIYAADHAVTMAKNAFTVALYKAQPADGAFVAFTPSAQAAINAARANVNAAKATFDALTR